MKQFVMRSWKKVCSMFLVLMLSLGGGILWYAEGVLAEGTPALQETSLTYQGIEYNDEAKQIRIRLKVDEGVTVGDDSYYNANNQIMLDGTISSDQAYYFNPKADEDSDDKILWLIIPYEYFDGATTEAEVKAKTHSIVIPQGSGIGSALKAQNDVGIILKNDLVQLAVPVTLSFQSEDTGGAVDGNQQYVITPSFTGADSITWEEIQDDTYCVLDGVERTDAFTWNVLDGNLVMVIKYAVLEPSTKPNKATGVGEHEIMIPAGTVIGGMILKDDFRVEVKGYDVQKGPDVVLKSSVFVTNTNSATEVNLQMDQVDDLSTNENEWELKVFTEGGISLNGVLGTNTLNFRKLPKEDKLYNVWFQGRSLSPGTIMTVDGKIKEKGYYAKFERTHFKYVTGSEWSEYTPTELSIETISQCKYQESGDQYVIYMSTSGVVPGNVGQIYCVTVDIDGNSSEQTARKVSESLWALSVPRTSIPADGTEVTVTVKASKEIMSNQDMSNQDNCEIVTITSDFSSFFWGVLRGDANSDGDLDLRDIVHLIRYIGDNNEVSVGEGADADGNNSRNEDDITTMRDYLLTGQKECKCSHRVIE